MIAISARTKSGGPEVHEQWTDVIMVTGGEATLLMGGKVVGGCGKERRSGETEPTSQVEQRRW
jgi:hypothetical protein